MSEIEQLGLDIEGTGKMRLADFFQRRQQSAETRMEDGTWVSVYDTEHAGKEYRLTWPKDDSTKVELAHGLRSHQSAESFILALVDSKAIKLPLYRIICMPPLEPGGTTGEIYYFAEIEPKLTDEKCAEFIANNGKFPLTMHFFRGTFGYGGSGPTDSATIEAYLKKSGLVVETRGPDMLPVLLLSNW